MEPLVPEGYTLIKNLSESPYRKVSLVKNIEDDKRYIIKVYDKKKIMENKSIVQSVLNEKKVLAEIDHPKIIKLRGTFKDDDNIGLILDLAKGIGLSTILQSHQKLPAELVSVIICQLIEIFEYLQSNGYVYKDLKASHVFLDKNSRITLIDLGMVEKLESGERSYIPAGTFHSMAPEMIDVWESSILNSGKVDQENLPGYNHNIDLYAIGVLIHELLLGKPPYGYLQAIADKEKRLEYFTKTREGINNDEQLELIEENLGKVLNEQQNNLIDLMNNLLKPNHEERLGANRQTEEIKQHSAINWYNFEDEAEYLDSFTKKSKCKLGIDELNDILSFVETCGIHNESDFADDEKLNEEEQKIFDDF
ncbi:unnamed protein product [Moneuplotes crassus]|uniref:Protein kinase domain-containing protein n=1 Tax=Euplotes crassus TaxID=5936 RepID=A0AAD2CWM4_EUPCR|nr:unnamed protein product [Moneuplotes crassus]